MNLIWSLYVPYFKNIELLTPPQALVYRDLVTFFCQY